MLLLLFPIYLLGQSISKNGLNLTNDTFQGNTFAQISLAVGTIIMFSTKHGQFASDGKGRNSLSAEGLSNYLNLPKIHIETLIKKVGEWVDEKTNYCQSPWPSGRIRGEFFFNKKSSSFLLYHGYQLNI